MITQLKVSRIEIVYYLGLVAVCYACPSGYPLTQFGNQPHRLYYYTPRSVENQHHFRKENAEHLKQDDYFGSEVVLQLHLVEFKMTYYVVLFIYSTRFEIRVHQCTADIIKSS